MVEHTPRSFCGQIGSHKARGRYRRTRKGGVVVVCLHAAVPRWVISVDQLRHAAVMHASDCTDGNRGACHGRPSANLIYAPAIHLQTRCKVSKGQLADQAHLVNQLHHGRSHQLQPARPTALSVTLQPLSSHRQPPFLLIASNELWGAGLAIPKAYRQLHRDPRQCPDYVSTRCEDIGRMRALPARY